MSTLANDPKEEGKKDESAAILAENKQKNKGLAALLSFLFPGSGQFYNGGLVRGVIFLIGILIGLVLFILPGIFIWIYGVYDAYSTAKKANTGEIPFQETNNFYLIIFIIIVVLVLIGFSIFYKTLMYGLPMKG